MRNLTAAALVLALPLAACATSPRLTSQNRVPVVPAYGASWVNHSLVVQGFIPVTIGGRSYYCDPLAGPPSQWRSSWPSWCKQAQMFDSFWPTARTTPTPPN